MLVTAQIPVVGLAKGVCVGVDGVRVTDEAKTKEIGKVLAARVPRDGVLELDLDVEDLGFYRVSADHLSVVEEPSRPAG